MHVIKNDLINVNKAFNQLKREHLCMNSSLGCVYDCGFIDNKCDFKPNRII